LGVLVTTGLAVALPGCSGQGPGENVGSSASAITFANDQPAFDFFLSKGLTNFQAAGIVGNLDQESGVDPTAVEAGGPGRGIAQWSVGGRWDTDVNDNATSYAATEGLALLSLQLQLDFIWYELTTFPGYGLADLKQTTNVTDATVVFETDFEGCGTCDQSTRIMYAQNVLAAFGGDTVDASAPDATTGDASGVGTPCTVTTTGESGVCMVTSSCAALGNHVSTPGFCPGPDDVQCCTATTQVADGDAGTGTGTGTGMGTDASSPPPLDDAGTSRTNPDAGTNGNKADAGLASTQASPQANDGGDDGGDGTGATGSSGGCATTPTGSSSSGGAIWLAAGAWVASRRRRKARV
jgi:MYXO-CTERM domain-containing protein